MLSARAKTFEIYGIPLLLIVAGLTIVPTLLNMFREVPQDFAVFMMSARALRQGFDPYHELLAVHAPNANPPAFLFAMLPLTMMSDRLVFVVWTLAAALALIFSLKKTATALKMPLRYLLLVAVGLQGVSAALRFGQVTLLLLPLMTLAWLADREGRQDTAGGWLGVLMYIKPFVGLYALYMLWRREWRTLRSMVSVFMFLALSGLLAGIDVTVSWIENLRSVAGKTALVANASWLAVVSRVFLMAGSQQDPAYMPSIVAPRIATAVWLGGVAAIGLISLRAVRRTANRDLQWSITGTAMLLISPLGWMYYIPLLIPPLAATIPSIRHLVLVLIGGAMLWVPSSVLARNTFGPLATATFASPYTWGLLVLWAAVCLGEER